MKFVDGISTFPYFIRKFIFFFIITLSFGYFSGFKFIVKTTDLKPEGIEENYVGNEDNDDTERLRFRKSEGEILTTIHTHVLSFSLIFFCIGILLVTVPINKTIKQVLIIEPFLSIILTFGGIWLMWLGYGWMKYIIMVSGMLITLTFLISIIILVYYSLRRTSN